MNRESYMGGINWSGRRGKFPGLVMVGGCRKGGDFGSAVWEFFLREKENVRKEKEIDGQVKYLVLTDE